MLRFRFFAPSGHCADPAVVARAKACLEARGHRVVCDPSLLACDTRFAGSDDERLAAILRTAADGDADVAIALRGGYGLSRLMDRLDFAALTRSRVRWVGYSDFTLMNLALRANGVVSLQGPMVVDLGAEAPSAPAVDALLGLLTTGRGQVDVPAPQDWAGELRGVLWGGNLVMMAHLIGTPWWPRQPGDLLFIEDVAEAPFRVDRLLHQLDHAGVLRTQRALLLGDFGGYSPGPTDNGFDMPAVVAYWRARLGIPVLTGLPFGHIADKLSLPVGGDATLRADRDGWSLRYSLGGEPL